MEKPSNTEREIVVFYNRIGSASFYLHSDGETFYDFLGNPIAYLFNESYLVSFSGVFLGWIYNGWVISYEDGGYAFFTKFATGGPLKPLRRLAPLRGLKKLRPLKKLRKLRPNQPLRRLDWTANLGVGFFDA